MRLWIESAQQSLPGLAGETTGDYVRTLTTEDQFLALVANIPGRALSFYLAHGTEAAPRGSCARPPLEVEGWGEARAALQGALTALERDTPLETVTQTLLAALPEGVHLPVALLQVRQGSWASLVECDAPPLFMARGGRLVLLPVIEEESYGRLIRRCDFDLQDGDHMALVSEGFLQGLRWDRRWGWRDIAIATRRITATRCDAGQLAGALVKQYQRRGTRDAGPVTSDGLSATLAPALERPGAREPERAPGSRDGASAGVSHLPTAVSVLAMFVRPMRTLTLWSGPPASRAAEREMLDRLMAEEDVRVISGDTTAEIAARLLGAQLVIERRPPDGWREVPPTSRMIDPAGTEEVDLVTEGVVTMTVARGRLASAHHPRDVAGQGDGASRLAQMLLTADKVQFLVGTAVNPAQVAADGTPLRRVVVEKLVEDLRARGKIVSVEHF